MKHRGHGASVRRHMTVTGPESIIRRLNQGGQGDFSAKNHSSPSDRFFAEKSLSQGY
jgi:hypothetical protein